MSELINNAVAGLSGIIKGLGDILLGLISLAILAEVAFGQPILGDASIVTNLTNLLNSFDNGLIGLVALLILLGLLRK